MATREIWQSLPADHASDYGLNRRITTYTDSKEASWIDGWWKPPWVEAEFSASRHWNLVHAHRVVVTPILQEKHAAQSAHSIRVTGSDGSFGSLCSGAFSNFNSARQLNDRRQSPDSVEVQGVQVSSNKFFGLVQKCIRENNEAAGRKVHYLIGKNGLESDAFLGTFVIRMFVLFGSLSEANEVFRKLSNPNVFSWNAIISAHLKFGQNDQAIQLYLKMKNSNIEPSGHVYVSVLKACSGIAALEQGRQIHTDIIGTGFESDVFVGSTVIDMYAKCGRLDEACIVFGRLPTRNVVTWSTLISGYAQHFHAEKALQLFKQMQQEGMQPNQVTFVLLLKACSSIADQEQGKWIHEHIIESGLEVDQFVGSTLVDMYAKCGNLVVAHTVFDRLPRRDLVTWSALIAGYAQHGHGQEALQLFEQMAQKGIKPDRVTFVCVLQSCSSIAAIEQGKLIHTQIINNGFESDLRIGSTLIDMYAKCGSLGDASMLFDRLPQRNVVTWSAMIAGYAQHSNYNLALRYFEDMQRVGLKPNAVTYLSLLSACSHMHLVKEGCLHLKLMREDHGITPALQHYNSVADLLGRAGCVLEAEDLLESVPFRPDIVGWTSLLGSCSTQGNVNVGRRCFDRILMEGGCSSAYLLMSNIYTHAGMWEDAEKIEEMRISANAWKKPAKAFIEIENQVHAFTVGDSSHPQSDDIYAKLKILHVQMKEQGYRPRVGLFLEPKLDGEKEDALCGHCEKLAIAFGLLSAPAGTTIRVAKNLRVCADCHDAAKIISKIEMREIIVSDAYSIHHFKDGACCCNEHR